MIPERNSDKLREETPPAVYDQLYAGHVDADGGQKPYAAYDRPYWDSHYYPLWMRVYEEVDHTGARNILEVGCGSGSFAHLLFDRSSATYHGFDFSAEAIAKARRRTGRPDCFTVSRAEDDFTRHRSYDSIVCLEVLEHIERDLEVVEGWRTGTRCICSVPNFDQPDHVRFFRQEDEVRRRYGGLIDLERVDRVPRALVRGRGWLEYGRQLRWSRNDPKRLLALLGYKTFENLAGWIVFSGIRRG